MFIRGGGGGVKDRGGWEGGVGAPLLLTPLSQTHPPYLDISYSDMVLEVFSRDGGPQMSGLDIFGHGRDP